MSASPTPTLAESIPLVAAHAARIAEDAGIRLLLIKGQPATDLGVRAERPSVDVDVWIDPARQCEYQDLLAVHGWQQAMSPPAGVPWDHATVLSHAHWPCTIDVHGIYPGFLTDPDIAFEEVWAHREVARIGSETCLVPGVVPAAAITFLHAERSRSISATGSDLQVAITRVERLSDDERRGLEDLALRTNSQGSLLPLLRVAGATVRPEQTPTSSSPARRVAGSSRPAGG